MAGVRKMARETDKTDREEEWEAERSVVHIRAAEVLGEFVWFVCTPVMGYVQYRYDVKLKTNAFFLLSPKWEMIH